MIYLAKLLPKVGDDIDFNPSSNQLWNPSEWDNAHCHFLANDDNINENIICGPYPDAAWRRIETVNQAAPSIFSRLARKKQDVFCLRDK